MSSAALPLQPAPPRPPASPGGAGLMLDMLFAPQRAMPVVAQRRRTLWMPLLTYALLFAVLWIWYYQQVDFAWMIEQMVQDALRRNPGAKPAQMRQGLAMMTPGVMAVSVIVAGLLMMLAIEFIRALYHHVSGKLIEQGDVPMLTWMAVQIWSALPSALSLALSLGYMASTDLRHLAPQAVSLTSLNAVLQLPASHPYATWAGAFDLMLLWTIGLTSLNAVLQLPASHPYATWAGAFDLMLLWTIGLTAVACRQLKGVGPIAAVLWAAGPFIVIYGAWALGIAL